MPVKLFILGLPGSGKSSAARYIRTYIAKHSNNWSTERKNDYTILHRMCYVEKDARMHPTEYDGFDVLEHSAFNSALKRLNSEVLEEHEGSGNENQLTTIEFSRNDYNIALEEFFLEFLTRFHKSIYFLFIETDISVCKERIQERVSKPLCNRSADDHPVSDFIFETYYRRDEQHYCDSVVKRLQQRFYVPDSHIQVILNSELTDKDFQEKVGMFVVGILSDEITVRSSPLPQSYEEELEQHIAENESGTEIQASLTNALAEAIPA